MVSIHIDIKTRVLPSDHRVYVVRPGGRYRLYGDVRSSSAILYDVPALSLEAGKSFSKAPEISKQIQRGRALKRWYRIGRSNGEARPSEKLEDYPDRPESITERQSISQIFAVGMAYFERAKVGDLVVVPPLKFGDEVLIGEIAEKEPVTVQVPIYDEQSLYGRRVRWLTSIAKNDIPPRVIEISQKPNSFVQLERSTAVWFYDRTYRSYVLDGAYQCELRVRTEDFGSTDDVKLTAFLNFVVANMQAVEARRSKPLHITEALFADLGKDEPSKRIAISSPGEIVIYALKHSPLLFVALLALAGCAPSDVTSAIGDQTVIFGNSAAGPDDPCAAQVYQSTLDWLTFVGADLWKEACPIAAQALDSAEIELPATVNVVP
jgi:hypothetical protein